MSAELYSASLYVLGFIGLAAVGLIPVRAWSLWTRLSRVRPWSGGSGLTGVLALVLAAVALASDGAVVLRVFRCLTTAYCGPALASGWGYLAMLGVVYLVFEAGAWALRRSASHSQG